MLQLVESWCSPCGYSDHLAALAAAFISSFGSEAGAIEQGPFVLDGWLDPLLAPKSSPSRRVPAQIFGAKDSYRMARKAVGVG